MSALRYLEGDWWDAPLPETLSIGDRSWLYSSYAFLHCHDAPRAIEIGHDTGIYVGTMFEIGAQAWVRIGNYCTITEPWIVTNHNLTIGDHALISFGVVIADRPFAAPPGWDHISRAPDPNPQGRDIVIGDNVWIGAHAVVLGGAEIGDGAVIGARTVIDSPVEPYTVVAGNPARVVRRIR